MEHVTTGIVVQAWELFGAVIGLMTFALSIVIMGFGFMNKRFDRIEDKIDKKIDDLEAQITKNTAEIATLHERTGRQKQHGH